MDILTEKGQATVVDEKNAYDIFKLNYPFWEIIETDKNSPSDFDAFLSKSGVIKAIVEVKCRYDFNEEKFFNTHNGLWLVTFDKILKLKGICDSLCVDMIGFLYIVPSKILLVKTLYRNGVFLTGMEIRTSVTQRSVNGGTATRTNAYINMRDAKRIIG